MFSKYLVSSLICALTLLSQTTSAQSTAAPSAAAAAEARSPIELASVTKMERPVKQADGSVKKTLVDAKSAAPGDDVIIINSFKNHGKQPAASLSLVNPVPANTILKEAFGEKASITYSLDGGKVFDTADKLNVVTKDGKSRPARMEDFTHVRWVLAAQLPPGQKGEVGLRVQVK